MENLEESRLVKDTNLETVNNAEMNKIATEQFGLVNIQKIVPVTGGIINETFFLDADDQKFVLQRLHKMFNAQSVADRVVVSDFLKQKGWNVPQYANAQTGQKFATDIAGRICTLYSFIPGTTVSDVESMSESQSLQAGRVLRRFHDDLEGFSYTPTFKIEGFRDVKYHAELLQSMLPKMENDARNLSQQVLNALTSLDYLQGDTQQVIHGDPKIANFVCNAEGEPFSIIDFDTLMLGSRFIDIGDLLRSLSTTGNETSAVTTNRRADAALHGYYNQGFAHMQEKRFSKKAYEARKLISLDLCSMFLIDIINDSYFNWDASQYSSRAAHNFARASHQWNTYEKLV
ncbi:hypothetical protein A2763_01635 [Candidatus Kaiserbacteria bacterium RIFCSPHIGHO2_01_FULL_54_36]|uniref:Aminoglycoside phosphotransferase domain-containing protein n=1 Tax=Candidatus Kaiserbacteria bacterium RIFCSPHIGHO2_01_FULL_54_36 TaxID=1798482 RepID=A0A1F6CKU8_9BACT|nr:MAG: hypothetical protein A2763_01635 [Candidatus Kaiserbacteria bacterium RIFCSPHIGHO2_01_FULL_54_36]OGG75477.1 MAG: hypothetical protein A3A41_01235 [Candidatus Kaiserbacteria bacterium RIFCSPLOWO2_01_FULL_54_22]